MTMRSKPGSALIVKQSKDSFSSPLSKKQQESNLEESGSVKSHRKSSQAKIEAPTELALREKSDAILSETEQAHLIPNEQIQKSEEKILSGKLPCEIQQGYLFVPKSMYPFVSQLIYECLYVKVRF